MVSNPYRRRRYLWTATITTGVLVFLVRQGTISLGLPESFSLSRPLSLLDSSATSTSLSQPSKPKGPPAPPRTPVHVPEPPPARLPVREIHGLLHLVATSTNLLPVDSDVDGSRTLDMSVYADAAASGTDWQGHLQMLRKEHPVVVFSKTYCPYSRSAKDLLHEYDLSPPPSFVELDQRDDSSIIKQILIRLTGRGTVPNVILNGISLGGSDDIHGLHAAGKLRGIFEEAGVQVRGSV